MGCNSIFSLEIKSLIYIVIIVPIWLKNYRLLFFNYKRKLDVQHNVIMSVCRYERI